jgi:hypothetical protein
MKIKNKADYINKSLITLYLILSNHCGTKEELSKHKIKQTGEPSYQGK